MVTVVDSYCPAHLHSGRGSPPTPYAEVTVKKVASCKPSYMVPMIREHSSFMGSCNRAAPMYTHRAGRRSTKGHQFSTSFAISRMYCAMWFTWEMVRVYGSAPLDLVRLLLQIVPWYDPN